MVMTENSSYSRTHLRKRIINNSLIPYKCAICKIGPEWQGKPMPLILDHINGVNDDHRISNLRFVCSNCDCQLPTYKSKNRFKEGTEVGSSHSLENCSTWKRNRSMRLPSANFSLHFEGEPQSWGRWIQQAIREYGTAATAEDCKSSAFGLPWFESKCSHQFLDP